MSNEDHDLPTSFSSKPNAWFFTIDSFRYVAREAKEDAVIAYKDVSMRHLQFSEGVGGMKSGQLSGGAEADAVLVSRCLFKIVGDGEDAKEVPVSLQEVKSMRHAISKRIYMWIKKNSAMEEEEETIDLLERRIKDDTAKLARLKKGDTEGKDSCSSTASI